MFTIVLCRRRRRCHPHFLNSLLSPPPGSISKCRLYGGREIRIPRKNKCTFCNIHEETVTHIFYECTHTQLFWKEVSLWLKTFQIILEPLDETHVLFGVANHKQFLLINHIVLIGKQSIYASRCKKIKPNLDLFISNIKCVITIEQNTAQRREALKHFNDKWSCVSTRLPLNDT